MREGIDVYPFPHRRTVRTSGPQALRVTGARSGFGRSLRAFRSGAFETSALPTRQLGRVVGRVAVLTWLSVPVKTNIDQLVGGLMLAAPLSGLG